MSTFGSDTSESEAKDHDESESSEAIDHRVDASPHLTKQNVNRLRLKCKVSDSSTYYDTIRQFKKYPYINYAKVVTLGYLRQNFIMDKALLMLYNDNIPSHLCVLFCQYSVDEIVGIFQLSYYITRTLQKITRSTVKEEVLNLLIMRYLKKGLRSRSITNEQLAHYREKLVELNYIKVYNAKVYSISDFSQLLHNVK